MASCSFPSKPTTELMVRRVRDIHCQLWYVKDDFFRSLRADHPRHNFREVEPQKSLSYRTLVRRGLLSGHYDLDPDTLFIPNNATVAVECEDCCVDEGSTTTVYSDPLKGDLVIRADPCKAVAAKLA